MELTAPCVSFYRTATTDDDHLRVMRWRSMTLLLRSSPFDPFTCVVSLSIYIARSLSISLFLSTSLTCLTSSMKESSLYYYQAVMADDALLLTSLESSCNAEQMDEIISIFPPVFDGSLRAWCSRSLPDALIDVSRRETVRSTSFVHPLLSSCFEFILMKLGYKPSTVDSNDDDLIRPFVSMYFGAAYITWRSTPPIFSPSLDKRFWSTLRSRVDSLIEDRNKSESGSTKPPTLTEIFHSKVTNTEENPKKQQIASVEEDINKKGTKTEFDLTQSSDDDQRDKSNQIAKNKHMKKAKNISFTMFIAITFPFFGGLLGFLGGLSFAPTTYFVSFQFFDIFEYS
ncbi:hypothetical protein ACFE04_020505 [Oxalis oulophora]